MKVHEEGFKLAKSLEWRSAVASVRIEFDMNMMLQLKEKLNTTFSKSNRMLSMMGLYKGQSNTKCASFFNNIRRA